jgi:uncharacterized protein YndB with AHSA1/START domain
MAPDPEVRWPDRYTPRRCPVHVRNELSMPGSSPARVWAWLVRASLWPTWYVNSANVRILAGGGPDLRLGTRFRWRTFGVTITSTVLECVPGERIAWDAHAFGVDAYHAWVLRPVNDGCHVLTEETQHGALARLSHLVMPGRMHKFHQVWLEALEKQSRTEVPPGR